ncbi:MAG: PadR family transcriptional regulator [Planctomycetota bacterium]|jgi:PadR family transcriptional regulator PadR
MEAGEWTTQLRRGVLEFCILQILHYRPSYGYEIVSRLESLGPLAAGENTVYPILRRLNSDRVVEAFLQESPSGPPRRYYRLTPEGRKKLVTLAIEWDAVVHAIRRCTGKE